MTKAEQEAFRELLQEDRKATERMLEEHRAQTEKQITGNMSAPAVWWKRYVGPAIAAFLALATALGIVWSFAGDHLITTKEAGDAIKAQADKNTRRNRTQDRAIEHQAKVQEATYTGVQSIGRKLDVEIPDLPQRPALPPEDNGP